MISGGGESIQRAIPAAALGTDAQAGQRQQEQHQKDALLSEHAGVVSPPASLRSWCSIPIRHRVPSSSAAVTSKVLPSLRMLPTPEANATGNARAQAEALSSCLSPVRFSCPTAGAREYHHTFQTI